MLADSFDLFTSLPNNAIIAERDDNEAYALVSSGQQYAVYFPDGGNVRLNVSNTQGTFQFRWLNITNGTWLETHYAEGGGNIDLQTPDTGHWVVVIQRN
jgi:hypothetical protein